MNAHLPAHVADVISAMASVQTQNTNATAKPDTDSSSSTTSTGSNTITSGDFLTLLVAEMKNQDPTQPSDPTQYIQQLVGVNSLQQLIAINQDLGGSAT
jgi:flagellar basal-body rod modification protein FlgD